MNVMITISEDEWDIIKNMDKDERTLWDKACKKEEKILIDKLKKQFFSNLYKDELEEKKC